MAPVVSKKRSSIRAKSIKSAAGISVYTPPVHRPEAIISDGFLSSKKDKRTIKHSSFINKISKPQKKPLKRRRPSKKLVATLESLADALPDVGDGDDGERVIGDAKIRHKTVRTRPGATKRREKADRIERERFGQNMAQLAVGSTEEVAGAGGEAGSTSSRWKALRGFISQTLEQKEDFVKK